MSPSTDESTRSLAALLDPISLDDFFERHWQKKPLAQCPKDSALVTTLVGSDDVEMLATIAMSTGGTTANVLAARCVDGQADYWKLPAGVAPTVAVHSLLHAFDQGYSIVVNAVDRFWAPINRLARSLESAVQQPVGANLYYSPAGVQSFPAHFDKHDVLAVQVSGHKTWELFEPEVAALHADADPWNVPSLDTCAQRVTLVPGSLLYLPRGWSHRVRSGSDPSLHVTFTIRTLRWADLVQRAAERAIADDVGLQTALPLHHDVDPAAINSHVAQLLTSLTPMSGFDAHQALLSDVLKTRPAALTGQIAMLAPARDLPTDAVLRRRDGLRPLVTVSEPTAPGGQTEVTIRFAGNGVTVPTRLRPALDLITRRLTCTIDDLTVATGEDCSSLAHALIANGLLFIED